MVSLSDTRQYDRVDCIIIKYLLHLICRIRHGKWTRIVELFGFFTSDKLIQNFDRNDSRIYKYDI